MLATSNFENILYKCMRVLLEGLFVPLLLYGSETMIWREKERSRINTVQIDNPRGLLGIKSMDTVLNVQISVL